MIPDPLHTTTHAITVRASAEAVWPWLVQIGQNRGGFYTYDALENLAGLNVRSAPIACIRSGRTCAPVRTTSTLDPDETMKMVVAVIEPPKAFVVRSGGPGEPPQEARNLFRGEMAWTWGSTSSRPVPRRTAHHPLARLLAAHGPAAFAQAFALEPAHFIIEEGMLRGIRDRVERAGSGG